jgi:NAD(P)-dependent dehydrogenase (short-subunit alcohol dehydrogenase family)
MYDPLMTDLIDLSGKIALITGGSSGMGKAIATAMGLHGATIVLSSNKEHEGLTVAQSLIEMGIDAKFINCDMTYQDDVIQLYQQTIYSYKRIDILVSCVGIDYPGSILDYDDVMFQRTMAINLENVYYLTSLILPNMQKMRGGSLIYLASIAGVRGNKNIGLYGITKAGLIQMVKNLAVEFGPDNIRANTISPGLIETPFSKSLMEDKSFMERRLSLTPLRRVGQEEEIAGVAVMLASKAGGFITGQNIIVDGGTVISDGN